MRRSPACPRVHRRTTRRPRTSLPNPIACTVQSSHPTPHVNRPARNVSVLSSERFLARTGLYLCCAYEPFDDRTRRGSMVTRCSWAEHDELRGYHDFEWGVPIHDDPRLFELLTLEGTQAGLSWLIVLRRRDGYRSAFADFDPEVVADYTSGDVDRLIENPEIIRHRGKIESVVSNAQGCSKSGNRVRAWTPYCGHL